MISILYTYPEYYYGIVRRQHLFKKITVMKNILAVAASLILVVVSANSQVEKKEPPPPPPNPKEKVKYKIEDEKVKNTSLIIIEEKVNASRPSDPPVVTVKGKIADDFYNKNPTVTGISRQANIITLKMKDGTTEKYDMSKKEEDKSFTEKFGLSPIPPPPPPPKIIKTKS